MNLVLGERLAFIDWDGAGPGSRLWDLAYAAHGFVPLSADPAGVTSRQLGRRCATGDPVRLDVHFGARLRTLVDAYGLAEQQRHDLVNLLAVPARAMYELLSDGAATGTQPWARLWDEGHGQVWRSDTEFIERRQEAWLHALLG